MMNNLDGVRWSGKTQVGQTAYSSSSRAPRTYLSAQQQEAVRAESMPDAPERQWEQTVRDCAGKLMKAYAGLDLRFDSLDGADEIRDYALEAGAGMHLVISKEFLEGMAASREAFEAGKKVIDQAVRDMRKQAAQALAQGNRVIGMGVVVQEDGKVAQWQLHQKVQKPPIHEHEKQKSPQSEFWESLKDGGMVKHYKEKGGRNVTEIKTPKGTIRIVFIHRLNYMPGKDLARLARISQVSDTHTFIAGIHAAISRAKRDSTLDEEEVRQAVAQMKGVVRRARAKAKSLKEEAIMEKHKKELAEKRERERALQIEIELKKRRAARKSKEYAQIGSDPGDLEHRKSDYEIKIEAEQLAEAYVAGGGGGGVTVAGDVSVTLSGEGLAAAPASGGDAGVSVNITI